VARNRVGTALIVSLCSGLAVALLLLELTLARQKKLDLHRANSVQRFSREVEEMWKDNGRQFVPIRSSDLAELADLPPRQADVLTTRLTLGLSINHEPLGQAMQYAPFLSALEQRMERVLRRPVLIDLRLYKSQVNSVRDAARGELDVQRMGALFYVLSQRSYPGLEPVVLERSQTEAVIFARKDSGITNLAAVSGKRVAFGQTNSTISFWAKVHLAQAGIRASQLQSIVHLNGTNPGRAEDPSRPIGSEDRDSEIQAHKRVIEEVFRGRADVGEAPRRQFELARYKRQGLVPLHLYRFSSEVYVARPGLDPDVVRALREAFVSYHGPADEKLLAQLRRNVLLEGFERASDRDFDDIRRAQGNEVAEFERGARNEIFDTQSAPPR
jgi:ABC-type phosphate/phosphonate transport system substrate-binding protein